MTNDRLQLMEQLRVSLVRTMRRALIDHARKRADLPALEQALARLAAVDQRKSRIVELKFFRGLTTKQIAKMMGISVANADRELRLGKNWLWRELSREPG
jgi:RNA polymerase sigma factor (sigma-70 family)